MNNQCTKIQNTKITKYRSTKIQTELPLFDRGLGLIMNNPSLLLLLRLHNFFQLSNKFGHGAGRQALRSWNIQRGIRRGAIFNFGQRRPAAGGGGAGGVGGGGGGREEGGEEEEEGEEEDEEE